MSITKVKLKNKGGRPRLVNHVVELTTDDPMIAKIALALKDYTGSLTLCKIYNHSLMITGDRDQFFLFVNFLIEEYQIEIIHEDCFEESNRIATCSLRVGSTIFHLNLLQNPPKLVGEPDRTKSQRVEKSKFPEVE